MAAISDPVERSHVHVSESIFLVYRVFPLTLTWSCGIRPRRVPRRRVL